MINKASEYDQVIEQIAAITAGESDLIANMANISAVLFNGISDINWAGFYLHKDNQLVLGPFQGKPACIRIAIGKGVCGKAIEEQVTQVVSDVHLFEGHIACDANSNAEVVVPIIKNGKLIGVLDVDSPQISRFDNTDADYLSKVVDILINTMD
jgi:GAF domain-containing protein